MKKSIKVTLSIVVTLALYVAFYVFLVRGAAPEDYYRMWILFLTSVVGAFIGVGAGAMLTWYLQKKNLDSMKSNIISIAIAFVFGFLFGWLSISGMIIGGYIVEKEKRGKKK